MTTFSLVTLSTSSNSFPSPLATDWTKSWVSESDVGGCARSCCLFAPLVSSRSFKGTSSTFCRAVLLSAVICNFPVGMVMFPGPRTVTLSGETPPSATPFFWSELSRNPPANFDSRTKHSLRSDCSKSWGRERGEREREREKERERERKRERERERTLIWDVRLTTRTAYDGLKGWSNDWGVG